MYAVGDGIINAVGDGIINAVGDGIINAVGDGTPTLRPLREPVFLRGA